MLALNSLVSRAAYATPNLSSLILFGSVSTTCSFTDSVAVAMVESQFVDVLRGGYKDGHLRRACIGISIAQKTDDGEYV